MMKKANILTVSMIAILAVTNARADIASTTYVNSQIQPVAEDLAEHVADTTMHVTAADKAAWNAKEDASNKVTSTSSYQADIDSTTKYPSMAVAQAMIEDESGDLTESITNLTQVKQDELTSTGNGANVVSSGDGNVVTAVTAADGVVTVTKGTTLGSLATKSEVAESDLATALATKINGKEDVSNKVTSMSAQSTDAQYPSAKAVYDAISDLGGDTSDLDARLDVLEGSGEGSVAKAEQDAKDYADGKFQVKSTGASIGGANGSWTALSSAQLAALDSGATTTNIGKIATNESAIATLNGDANTNGSVAKSIADAIGGLSSVYDTKGSAAAAETAAKSYADGLASNYDAAGSAATAKSEAIAAAATDATSKANAAETAAKTYADNNFQPISEKATDLSGTFADDTKYPSAKAVKAAIAAASSSAASSYQAKSTADLQIGTTGGVFRDMTTAEKAALASGVDATKVGTYDSVASAVNNQTTGLAATKAIADAAKSTADAALPAATYNTQVGTVSATNMGTTATTVVGAIKEVHDSVAALDNTYATDAALTSGLANKQDKSTALSVGNASGSWNTLAQGSGISISTTNGTTTIATAGNYVTVPVAAGITGKSVLTYDSEANNGAGEYYWEPIGR